MSEEQYNELLTGIGYGHTGNGVQKRKIVDAERY